MKRLLIIASFFLAPALVAAAQGATAPDDSPDRLVWREDFAAARAQAELEGRAMLLNFTGSDWCVWCFKLRDEVFLQAPFIAFAKESLMLVEVDFPQKKPQSAELIAQNRALDERFDVSGYPTIVVLNSRGAEIGRLGYMEGGAKTFVRALRRLIAAAE